MVSFLGYNAVTGATLADDAITLATSNTALLTQVEIAVIGGAIAALVIMNEFRKINEKKALQSAATSSDESEDFFND